MPKGDKVRDGYLRDLSEDIQNTVINISKIIRDKIDELVEDPNYKDLKSSGWAMSCIDEFKTVPSANGQVGSIRVFQKKTKDRKVSYECMIQLTGHFINHQYGWVEDQLRELIKRAYMETKSTIRKKYNMTIKNEGDMGNPNEGFDVYPNKKVAEEMWNRLEDRKTKTVLENHLEMIDDSGEIVFERGYFPEISDDLINYYENFYGKMSFDEYYDEASHGKLKYDFRKAYDWDTGHSLKIVYSLDDIEITNVGNGVVGINATPEEKQGLINDIQKNISKKGNLDHASKGQKVLAIVDRVTNNRLDEANIIGPFSPAVNSDFLEIPDLQSLHKYYNDKGQDFINRYVNKIKVGEVDNNSLYKSTHWFKNSESIRKLRGGNTIKTDNTITRGTRAESLKYGRGAKLNDIDDSRIPTMVGTKPVYKHPSKKDINRNPELYKKENVLNESSDTSTDYNTEMTEKQAKSTLRALSQTIINNNKDGDMGKGKNKVNQYTANIYANIITKNLLPKWAPGYKKFSITLDSYQSFFTFEFKTPTMSQDFISRFVDGREPISGFLHRIPEIKVRMSPRIFHTMENPDDAFFFFKSAIQYYDTKVEKYCKGLMAEVLKMNRSMKHLISTTKLSGLVTLPMSLLFVFDDAHMNNKSTFELAQEDINAVNQFMKNIYTRYAAPEKEKKKIVDDVKEMVKELRESCDESETLRDLYYLPEAVEKYFNGGFDNEMQIAKAKFENEQVDFEAMRNPVSYEVKYYQEKFGVKKLKKIPTDLVAYISIETEAIKDANDKMMIASYCLGKIEIVEWYIELLEVGSKKYIVPHNKPYLENVRTQLLACFKKIMATPIPKNDRPLIDVQYPKGYEG